MIIQRMDGEGHNYYHAKLSKTLLVIELEQAALVLTQLLVASLANLTLLVKFQWELIWIKITVSSLKELKANKDLSCTIKLLNKALSILL